MQYFIIYLNRENTNVRSKIKFSEEMPSHREISAELLTELEEGGGIQPKTKVKFYFLINLICEIILNL